ncbi:hypothetical protein FSP39_020463 [Pinctada imbricata]|uniref:Reverse transcriptase domain-containing protein n=2 Tax=Pinctada imbricata TaxID=66713 RepID=A0AA88YUF6_PINIB|nr:hypothetical protein FSP39_020463 [Pinctada imbricata]
MKAESTSNFYRLINRNSRGSHSTVALVENKKRLLDPNEQCRGFASFYEDLAIPKDSSSFDSDYKARISADLDLIRQAASTTSDPIPYVETAEVERAISKLHTKKAADEFGLVSEHLKVAGTIILEPLALIFNAIIQLRYIPDHFKSGVLHPIHKKGKDPSLFTNYRGITITPLFAKVFEHVILEKVESCLPASQSSLQFGFSKGLSPLMASLVLTETIVEAVENKNPLYVSFLDTQKAFDVVYHDSMKCKFFHQGVNHHIWNIVDELYSSLTSKVSWNGIISQEFPVLQGVRQGGILSTGLYKLYINDLLLLLEEAKMGTSIGTVYTGCPTVADDLSLASNSEHEAQSMLDIAYNYANRERYTIHPEKSVLMRRVMPKNYCEIVTDWKLGDEEITLASSAVHIGTTRASSGEVQINIEDRISCARRAFYSLTPSGLHGTNGLSPPICMRIYSLYVIPRLLYGLESFVLNRQHIKALESFHLSMLRIIQSLPQRTAKCITYLLLGARPIEAEIHMRCLTFLANIIRSGNTSLNRIMDRQICMKGKSSSSWFIYVEGLLEKYQLPSIQSLKQSLPSKEQWKTIVHSAVDKFWNQVLLNDCEDKSSLISCNTRNLTIGKQHVIWKSLDNNMCDTKRGIVKVRILTGTYIVQSTVSKFNQHSVDPTCQLCRSAPEDYQHMLLECGALLPYRKRYLKDLKSIISQHCGPESWSKLSLKQILQLCIDCTCLCENGTLILSQSTIYDIECVSRSLCYSVHCGRSFLLDELNVRKR